MLLVNDRVEPLVAHLNPDLEAADRALARARLSDGGTDFLPALTLVRDRLLPTARAARVEVHLLTDGQRRPWREGGRKLARLTADIARRAALYVEVFPPPTAENLAVTAAAGPGLEDPASGRTPHEVLPSIHAPVLVRAAVRNLGNRPHETVPLDIRLDGTPVDRRVVPRIEPGREEHVTFRFRVASPGTHRVEVEVLPGSADRLPADNLRFLALYVYDQVRVLVVDGDPRPGPYESESDFLRLALSPVDLDQPDAPFLVDTEVRTLEEMEGVRLADYQVVVLANVAGVSPAMAARLARFVGDGGGLIIFLGDQVDLRDYNDVLYAGGRGLLPARLTGLVGNPADERRAFGLITANLSHYLVNHYGPTDPTLSRVRVRAAIAADTSGVSDAEVVLRYTSGLPCVVTRPVGLGRVILVTTSADPDWANLPGTNALLPLLQRSLNYLVYGQHAPGRLNLPRGRPFRFTLRPEEASLPVTITDPEGSPRSFPGSPGRRLVEWTDTWRAGFYRMDLGGPAPRRDYFCVNRDTAESDLTAADLETLRAAAPGASITMLSDDRAGFTERLRRARLGSELWPYLLAAVGLLLLAEGFLARSISLAEARPGGGGRPREEE